MLAVQGAGWGGQWRRRWISPPSRVAAGEGFGRGAPFLRRPPLRRGAEERPDGKVVYHCGGTEIALFRRHQGRGAPTVRFRVEQAVPRGDRRRQGRGVVFEDYDLPGLKTEGHVCGVGSEKAAWFTDPEGNILCLHDMAERDPVCARDRNGGPARRSGDGECGRRPAKRAASSGGWRRKRLVNLLHQARAERSAERPSASARSIARRPASWAAARDFDGVEHLGRCGGGDAAPAPRGSRACRRAAEQALQHRDLVPGPVQHRRQRLVTVDPARELHHVALSPRWKPSSRGSRKS